MRIQPIQTYSNRVNSVKFMQKPEEKIPETSPEGKSHSPAGVLLTAAAIPAVVLYTVCTPKAPENTLSKDKPDSTAYMDQFEQIMKSPLVQMPKADPNDLLENGYVQISDGIYCNGETSVKIDSDYYEIIKDDTEYTRPMVDGQGYSNIRIYNKNDWNTYTDYRFVEEGDTVQLVQVLRAKLEPGSADDVSFFETY